MNLFVILCGSFCRLNKANHRILVRSKAKLSIILHFPQVSMRKPFLDVAEVWHLFCTWHLCNSSRVPIPL